MREIKALRYQIIRLADNIITWRYIGVYIVHIVLFGDPNCKLSDSLRTKLAINAHN